MLRTIQSTPTALGIARGKVALTFDDGPVPGGLTDALLDFLAAEQITAGFCLVGRRIPGNEAIVERIHAEGHLIVNHGDAHISPGRLSEDGFRKDLQSFDERIAEALQLLGWKSDYFRPAGGLRSRRLLELLDDCEKTLMPMTYFAWDVVPFPYFQRLICGGLKMNLRFRNAGLYMLHEATVPLSGEVLPAPPRDNRKWIHLVVERFVQSAKKQGCEFVCPSTLV